MRTRSAKKLAQRIDLNYFKHARGLRRWRTLLSIAAPLAGLMWLGGMAAAGSRAPYSSGPVSAPHAFVEMKCEVCHQPDTVFRAHAGEKACLSCHDAPAHPGTARPSSGQSAASDVVGAGAPPIPACASCHREHQGREAMTDDAQCVDCHSGSRVAAVGRFPDDHPEFAAAGTGAVDGTVLKFNHAVHAGPNVRGPGGPEALECVTCHKPELARASSRQRTVTGLMKSMTYQLQCARCHQLFFDERIAAAAPHDEPAVVRAFVRQALQEDIAANPRAMSERDGMGRRLPLNFPREVEPPARTAQEWVARRAARAENYLWQRACAECHTVAAAGAPGSLPRIEPVKLTTRWMPKARFDHAPHLMVACASCHTGVESSRLTSDVLMPAASTCATCHQASKGASSQCAECHDYHDWTKAGPVKPRFTITDFP